MEVNENFLLCTFSQPKEYHTDFLGLLSSRLYVIVCNRHVWGGFFLSYFGFSSELDPMSKIPVYIV